jgi:acetate kinase
LTAAACSGLEFLGIRLSDRTNARPSLDQEISTADSSVRVLVIRAEEDWAIAKECWKLAKAGTPADHSAGIFSSAPISDNSHEKDHQ